jgi:hypothetical protein
MWNSYHLEFIDALVIANDDAIDIHSTLICYTIGLLSTFSY